MRTQLTAVAVAALLVLAGCSTGGGGGTTASTDAVYESPLDAATVAGTHAELVRDAGTFTLVSTSNRTGEPSSGVESSTAVDLDSGAFHAEQRGTGPSVEVFGYGNGTAFQRVPTADGPEYSVPPRTPNATQLAGRQVEEFLALFSFSHARTDDEAGTTTHVYEASGVDALNESAPGFQGLDTGDVASVDAYVHVTADGLVARFGYSLTLATGDGETTTSIDQRYVDVGSTTVAEPAWLDDARANTSA